MTEEIQLGTIRTMSDRHVPPSWPKVVFLPWSTCACPTSWGECDPPNHSAKSGWWVNLTVQSYFGETSLVEVTGGGEGYSHGAAERHAMELALAALRRIDASTLTLEQLALRAFALCELVPRVEDACDG